ncbi:uncharacterized protein J3R85_020437 [Psidium guajava]|nr:uncharacterized protein J3R85_020437 [Psidium guajava]
MALSSKALRGILMCIFIVAILLMSSPEVVSASPEAQLKLGRKFRAVYTLDYYVGPGGGSTPSDGSHHCVGNLMNVLQRVCFNVLLEYVNFWAGLLISLFGFLFYFFEVFLSVIAYSLLWNSLLNFIAVTQEIYDHRNAHAIDAFYLLV